MNEILCTSPTIIKNPVQRYRLGSNWTKIYRDKPVRFVPPVRRRSVLIDGKYVDLSITAKDMDRCYYLNNDTGETIPMYIIVPCGKCIICRSKKAKEWTSRCICETQMHDEQPFFLTLTYNENNYPINGVDKDEVQRFFKRLRIRLERAGYTHQLRYILAAEYGSNTFRPHYHVMLWNFPKLTDFSYDLNNSMVATFLQDSWAKRVSKERYDELQDFERYINKGSKGQDLYYERIGFVHIKRAHDNTAGYLAKYIMKEQYVPNGMNPTFILSSRKNGIGYDYAKAVQQFYTEHPEQTTLEICNKFSGSIHTLRIPQYFKSIWRPTGSKYIGNKYPYYRVLRDVYNVLIDMLRFHPFNLNSVDMELYTEMINSINDKYPYLTPIRYQYDIDRQRTVNRLYAQYHTKSVIVDGVYIQVTDYDRFPKWSEILWQKYYDGYVDMFMHSYERLTLDVPSVEAHDENMRLQALFKGQVTLMMSQQPQRSVQDVVYELMKEQERLRIQDMY